MSPTIPSSLVSWWRFENDGKDEIDGNTLDTELLTSTGWVDGKVGNAMSVNDLEKYARLNPAPTNLQFSGDFTIEALVKLNTIPEFDYAYIIGELSGANHNYGLRITENSGKIGFYYKNNKIIQSSSALQTERWYYLAVVKSGNNFKLYIDGNEEGTGTSADSITYSKDVLYVGMIGGGLIDEVAVYNDDLSAQEIFKHAQNGLSGKGYFSD